MKNRSNIAASLLSNTKDLEAAFKSAQNAEGSALRENEKHLESIQGRIDLFNNSVQTMWNNAINDEFLKWVIDVGTELIKLVDDVGLLRLAFVSLFTYLTTKYTGINFATMFSGLTSKGINSLFGKSVNKDIDSTVSSLSKLEQKVKDAKQAYVNSQNDKTKQALKDAEDDLAAFKKLSDEGFEPQNKNQSYFGREIQKIKDYKKELSDLDIIIPEAEQKLRDAKNELSYAWSQGEFGGIDGEDLDKYVENVKNAQIEVDTLKQKQIDLKKTGSGAFRSLGESVSKFSKQVQSAIASMLVAYAISKVIQLVSEWWDKTHETAEEAKESFERLSSELSSTESELRTLESQLDEIQSRIKEINENTPLTFTDQEELSNLKAESAELQRQIDLLNAIKQQQAYSVNESAINAANKYEQIGVETGKTKKENIVDTGNSAGLIGAGIGSVALAGVGTTLATSALTAIGAGAAAGTWAGPIGMLIGAAIGAIVAGVGGAIHGAVKSANEETIGESIDNMKEQYTKLQNEFNVAREKYQNDPSKNSKKKFEEAQEALRGYQSNMASYMSEMDSYYSQIKANWDNATTEQKQEYVDWADQMDTWAIQTGGANAKSNAIARIFGDEAQGNIAAARDRVNELKKNLAEAKDSGVGVEDALAELDGFKLNLSEEEVERLRELGIYLYEVEDYFKNVVKTESEFVDGDLEDVAKDISKITAGLDSLKTAFDEVIEEGVLTAKTILSIKEELAIGDGKDTEELTAAWREYLDIMMSGVATTEQMIDATERLAQEYIEDALATNALNPNTKGEYIAQLRSLGIKNAEEYVDDLLQKNFVKELELGFKVDEDSVREEYVRINSKLAPDDLLERSWANMTSEEIAKLAEDYGILEDISEDTITEISSLYGITGEKLDEIVAKLREKKKIESQIIDQQKAENTYNVWRNGDGNNKGILALEEELEKYKTLADEYAKFSDKAKSFDTTGWTHYTARGADFYSKRDNGNFVSMDGDEYRKYETEAKEYQKWLKQNAEKYKEYLEIKKRYEALVQEGISNNWAELNEETGEVIVLDPQFDIEASKLQDDLKNVMDDIDTDVTVNVELELKLQEFDEDVDKIQDAYSTLKDIATEYNTQGYLSLDNLQALLNLSPEYLAVLQMEGGQLTINQVALEAMLKTKLADAKATAIQTAITKLNALAERSEVIAINDTTTAASNAALAMGSYTGTLSVFTTQAIQAAGAADALRAALEGAESNQYVKPEEVQQIWDNLTNSLDLIGSLEDALPTNFNNILDPGSKTADEKTKDTLLDKLMEDFQRDMDYWENRIGANQARYEQLQNEIDLLEAKGQKADVSYYDEQIRLEQERAELLEQQKIEAQKYLDQIVASGNEGSEEFWEVANTLNDIEGELDGVTASIVDLQDAIGEIDTYKFEEFNNRLDDLTSKLGTIRDLIASDEDDWFDDEGNWTEDGIAVLGTYIQELETYKQGYEKVKKDLDELSKYEYNDKNANTLAEGFGIHSEQEYYDRMQELMDRQYDYAESINDTEDSIVDMYESSIDAVEEYVDTLIDGYNDYIDSVKEALSAERD